MATVRQELPIQNRFDPQDVARYPWLAQFQPPAAGTNINPVVTAPPGTLTPAPTMGGSPAAGGKPFIPSPINTAQQAIRGNLRLLPNLKNIGRQLNQFQLNQLYNQLGRAIPGLQGLQTQAAANIGSALAGELPADVVNQILTNAAEFGVASGTGGGGADMANLAPGSLAGHMGLRSLGLSSLDQTRWGAGALNAALAGAPRVNQFDPTQFFVTPEQQQQARLLANYIAAAPDPEAGFQRALALQNAGMTRGFGSIPTASPGAPGGGGAPSSTSTMLQDLISRYLQSPGGIPAPGQGTTGTTTPPAAPTGPGWGYAPGSGGGTTQTSGNVPPNLLNVPGQELPAASSNPYDWLYAGA